MKSSTTVAFFAIFILAVAFDASAWDELGPLKQVRREHPEYLEKGAVHEVEVDGEPHWLFTGDGIRERRFFGGEAEAYREAALDARRNLVRHLTGNAPSAKVEVSGIVTAYRIPDGSVRRVVCLVPKENVHVVSPTKTAQTALRQGEETNSTVATDGDNETATTQPAQAVPAGAAGPKPPAGPPRFQMPDLPTPVLPGDNTP